MMGGLSGKGEGEGKGGEGAFWAPMVSREQQERETKIDPRGS